MPRCAIVKGWPFAVSAWMIVPALAAHGLPMERDLLLPGRFDQSVAHDGVFARMKEPNSPTAIFALSNMMMPGTLNALHELGLSIPADASVISIDDFDFANIMNPPPTVVAAPVLEMAQTAISALLDELASKQLPSGLQTVFEPRLIVRNSCAPRFVAASPG